eukprot:m.200630 g.200630  ORF g.200630 m.200630 type:complete len:985 (+) comp14964_c0_seq1:158-3112(+)
MDEQLQGLESVLDELTQPHLTSERKTEIEAALSQFKAQPHAWRLAIQFLEESSNPQVKWYAASVIQYSVDYSWDQLDEEDRGSVKAFLFQYLPTNYSELPHFVRSKLTLCIVAIAREEWPHSFPDFLDLVSGIFANGETSEAGASILLMVSEELSQAQRTSPERRQALRQALLEEAPGIILALCERLSTMHLRASSGGLRLPGFNVPSGRAPPSTPRGSPAEQMFAPETQQHRQQQTSEGSLHFTAMDLNLAAAILKALAHFFSWVPIATFFNESVFSVLATYSEMYEPDPRLGCASLRCFNELHLQQQLPPDFGSYLVQAFEHTQKLVQAALDGQKSNAHLSHSIDPQYLDVLVEYLRIFLENIVPRMAEHEIPIQDLIVAVVKLASTFADDDSYRLSIHTLLSFFEEVVMSEVEAVQNLQFRFSPDAMEFMLEQVISRLQLTEDERTQLLDDTESDDTDPSDYAQHVETCTQFISMVGHIQPLTCLPIASALYMKHLKNLGEMVPALLAAEGTLSEQDALYYQWTCRDFAAMCRVLAMLSDVFVSNFQQFTLQCQELLQAITTAFQEILDSGIVSKDEFLANTVVVQLVASSESLCDWINLCVLQAEGDDVESAVAMLDAILNVVHLSQSEQSTISVSEAGCHLLFTLCSRVASPVLMQRPLYNETASFLIENIGGLSAKAQQHAVAAQVAAFAIKWHGVSSQDWETRSQSALQAAEFAGLGLREQSTDAHGFIQCCSLLKGVVVAGQSRHTPPIKAAVAPVREAIEGATSLLFSLITQDGGKLAEDVVSALFSLMTLFVSAMATSLTTAWMVQLLDVIVGNLDSVSGDSTALDLLVSSVLLFMATVLEAVPRDVFNLLNTMHNFRGAVQPMLETSDLSVARAFQTLSATMLIQHQLALERDQMMAVADSLTQLGMGGDLPMFVTMLSTVEHLATDRTFESNPLHGRLVQEFVTALTAAKESGAVAQYVPQIDALFRQLGVA